MNSRNSYGFMAGRGAEVLSLKSDPTCALVNMEHAAFPVCWVRVALNPALVSCERLAGVFGTWGHHSDRRTVVTMTWSPPPLSKQKETLSLQLKAAVLAVTCCDQYYSS